MAKSFEIRARVAKCKVRFCKNRYHRVLEWLKLISNRKIVSEYDQEIPQSQTADNPEEEPLNHHETPGRQIKQSNQLSLPH